MVKIRQQYGASGEDASKGDSVDRMGGFESAVRGEVKTDGTPEGGQPDWLGIARDSFEDSTRFIESSLRWQWERNERAFQNRHPPGSKYLSNDFKSRSRLYRPKTRAMIRQGDATVAASFFSNEDVVSVKPLNDNDKAQAASAAVNKELLEYRLTTPNKRLGIPWFLTVVGAHQEAEKYGFVTSKQWWEFRAVEEEVDEPLIDPVSGEPVVGEDGQPAMGKKTVLRTIVDRPRVDLFPPENVRIDRGCNWLDPINTSPFVILLHPMYIHEVVGRQTV